MLVQRFSSCREAPDISELYGPSQWPATWQSFGLYVAALPALYIDAYRDWERLACRAVWLGETISTTCISCIRKDLKICELVRIPNLGQPVSLFPKYDVRGRRQGD